ncbi:MAG: sulfite exporter TauE/SafE family protein [Flavobacteriaceae bacterium]|nr:sulfite exporter TauE/SafE family protein [Flavobacteriaceae bacterium]
MIEYIEYFCAIIIGIVLGLTGGGGSILTVPVLVYIINYNPIIATSYSLFIVGMTSSFGTLLNYRKGNVVLKTGIIFAIPSLISVYLTRKYIVHSIPTILIDNSYFTVNKDLFLLLLFAVVMFLAALKMINSPKTQDSEVLDYKQNIYLVIFQIFCVGILIGLIGAGGGFLIIPALVHFAKLPIKKAIGTSLFIIACNSLIGFSGDVQNINPDWYFLIKFAAFTMTGILIGIYISRFFNDQHLKKIFGWFVLTIAILIVTKEILL